MYGIKWGELVRMADKLIRDIRSRRAPKEFWDDRAVLHQASLRWLSVLRNSNFTLPDFDHLDFMIVLTSSSNERITPNVAAQTGTMFRLVHCEVQTIPINTEKLLSFANLCIYNCFLPFCKNNQEKMQILDSTLVKLEAEQTHFQFVFKSTKSKNFKLDLLARPCGPYPNGGDLILHVEDKVGRREKSETIFEYCDFSDLKSFFSKLQITDSHQLEITSGPSWSKKFPSAPTDLTLSLDFFLDNNPIYFLSNSTTVQGALLDCDLPW